MSGTGDADDPFGDKAWAAARAAEKAAAARAAIGEDYAEALASPRPTRPPEPEDLEDRAAGVSAETITEELIDDRLVKIDAAIREEEGAAWEPDENGLPPACPVQPLGKARRTFYFLTPDMDVEEMTAGDFGQGGIDALFAGKSAYLYYGWPRRSQKARLGVAYDVARKNLMDACAHVSRREGPFDLQARVRGRGAWLGEDGRLVLHLGDQVIDGAERRRPGKIGALVYPAGPRLVGPPEDPDPSDGLDAGRRLDALLAGWAYARPELDRAMVLGWIAASMVCGALSWRPQVFLVGDAGTGKSSLQDILKAVLGGRVLSLADASPASIYQELRHDALAVALDEFENEESDRAANVLRLARISASGGFVGRGGQDGVPARYQARGTFFFSAVNMPSATPAELTRMGIVQLRPLTRAHGATAPGLSPGEAEAIGAALIGRMARHWLVFQDSLEAVRTALLGAGHDARSATQFGVLLAAAHVATHQGPPTAAQLRQIQQMAPAAGMQETASKTPNWRRCFEHLLAAQPDGWRSYATRSIGAALDLFLHGDADAAEGDSHPGMSLTTARARLAQAGLALVSGARDGETSPVWWLGVPHRHPAAAKLFEATAWKARAGADGGWTRALADAPGHLVRRGQFRLEGARKDGVLLDLTGALDLSAPAGERLFTSTLAAPNAFDGSSAGATPGREPGEEG